MQSLVGLGQGLKVFRTLAVVMKPPKSQTHDTPEVPDPSRGSSSDEDDDNEEFQAGKGSEKALVGASPCNPQTPPDFGAFFFGILGFRGCRSGGLGCTLFFFSGGGGSDLDPKRY